MSFFEVFQPALRYLRQEREAQKSLVTRPAAGAGGPLGIDLDGGKAVIRMPAARPGSEDGQHGEDEAETTP